MFVNTKHRYYFCKLSKSQWETWHGDLNHTEAERMTRLSGALTFLRRRGLFAEHFIHQSVARVTHTDGLIITKSWDTVRQIRTSHDEYHVIGFSDLVDLWVIKIKSPRSFAHVERQDQVNRERNTDKAARECWKFVYSTVNNKIVWFFK